MNQREKALLSLLLGSVVLYGGLLTVSWFGGRPAGAGHRDVRSLEAKVAMLEQHQRDDQFAEQELRFLDASSLPPDIPTAITLYQNWLLGLIDRSRLQDAVVTPGQAAEFGDGVVRIPFAVRAAGTLGQICELIAGFESASLLHRINRCEIDAIRTAEETRLHVTLQVEGLSLSHATPRLELPVTTIADASGLRRQRNQIDAVVAADPFASEPVQVIAVAQSDKSKKKRKRREGKNPERSPRGNPAAQTVLIAVVRENGRGEAWFYDRSTRQNLIVREGEQFDQAAIKGRLVRVDADCVQLHIDGFRDSTMQLGDALADLAMTVSQH